MFAAGFSLKKKRFFKYFSEICVFAVFGTVISTLVFAIFTWVLAKLHIVSAAAIGTRPMTECLLYGVPVLKPMMHTHMQPHQARPSPPLTQSPRSPSSTTCSCRHCCTTWSLAVRLVHCIRVVHMP